MDQAILDGSSLRDWQRSAIGQFRVHQGNTFTVVATPGAGKTTFALHVASELFAANRIDRVIVVVPTEHLKKQWRIAAAQRFNLQLDSDFVGRIGTLAADYQGIVTTYQWVTAGTNKEVLRWMSSQYRTLVVFDEIHHAGDKVGWGEAISYAFADSARRLCITGTPFRTDDRQIPFVTYDATGRSQADFSYGYTDALNDKVCRSVYFHTFEGDLEWESDFTERRATFRDALDERDSSQRLRTALSLRTNWLPDVIRAADIRLQSVRENDFGDAAGLVIAMNKEHARQIVAEMERILGERPMMAISGSPDDSIEERQAAAEAIDRFTHGDPGDPMGDPFRSVPRWLVAVKMVSEGVDIPRLCVGVYATNILTELFFRQAVGRFVRTIPDFGGLGAYVFVPKDPTLVAHITAITEERDHVVAEVDEVEGDVDMPRILAPGQARLISFEPLRGQSRVDNIHVGDEAFTQAEVQRIQEIKRRYRIAASVPDEAVLLIWRAFEQEQGPAVSSTAQTAAPKRASLKDEKDDLRARLRSIVNRVARDSGWQHEHINGTLNRVLGTRVNMATREQLQRRLDMLEGLHKWTATNPGRDLDGWEAMARRAG